MRSPHAMTNAGYIGAFARRQVFGVSCAIDFSELETVEMHAILQGRRGADDEDHKKGD